MFVTFRADRSRENDAAIQELISIINDNIQSHDEYSTAFRDRFRDARELVESDYPEFLCRSFPKLVLAHASSNQFDGRLCELYSYPRQAGSKEYRIVKFIFEFQAHPLRSMRGEVQQVRDGSQSYLSSILYCVGLMTKDVARILAESNGPLERQLGDDLSKALKLRDSQDPLVKA